MHIRAIKASQSSDQYYPDEQKQVHLEQAVILSCGMIILLMALLRLNDIQFPIVSPVRVTSWVREPETIFKDLQVPAVSPHVDCRQMSVSCSQGPCKT